LLPGGKRSDIRDRLSSRISVRCSRECNAAASTSTAPQEALDLLIEARTPVEDYPELRERGRRSRRNREHAWMLEKE